MTLTRVLGLLLILTCGPAAVRAQSPDAPSDDTAIEAQVTTAAQRPPQAREPVLRAYFLADSVWMSASQTFDAVVGTSRLSMRGGGGEVLGLWRGLFARVAFAVGEEEGSRVVVFDDEVIPLGIPLTVQVRPLEIGAGWRFRPFAAGRLTGYAGGGVLRLGYRERSAFATADDDVDATFTGGVVFGGLEASLVSWVIAGVEVQHRIVPDALGDGGVSAVYGETGLGGTAVRLLIGVRR